MNSFVICSHENNIPQSKFFFSGLQSTVSWKGFQFVEFFQKSVQIKTLNEVAVNFGAQVNNN